MPNRGSFRPFSLAALIALVILVAPLSFAQQTGSISGTVTTSDGSGLPGVTVEASSNVLPQARVTTTGLNGDYRMPALPPGQYVVRFTLSGLSTQSRSVRVNLGQDALANATLGMDALAETITVSAEGTLVDTTSTEIKSSLNQEALDQLPIGQEYRDLLKLAPGVQYTENVVRGPSAGGSEQDNVYQFDGVNVTLPLFGTLAAEPSTHDIAQVTYIKGGAKAVDFNRSAGFTIDSVSKSGTNEWGGEVKYQIQPDSWVGDRDGASGSTFDQDRDWATIGLGGPVVRDRLFFYGSYYRPTIDRANIANAYGEVPDFDSTRDEFFGKVTFTPTGNILLHGSYRDSDRTAENGGVGGFTAATAASDEVSGQTIGILEGSWVINDRSFATAKFTDYALETGSVPNTLLSVVPSGALGTRLNLNSLDQMGLFSVPSPSTNAEYNAFIAPLIDRYGFLRDGVRTGGGAVGGASQINFQDFYRQAGQLGYDYTFGQNVTHTIHVGYQYSKDEEDLTRSSNGFGSIIVPTNFSTCPAAVTTCGGQRVAFQADFQRSNVGTGTQVIHSEFEQHNIEINDTIQMGDWAFNVGVMLSNDILYGQGLREDSSTISGFVAAPGNKYKMYEVDFDEQIQPRLGATWAYNSRDTVYASYSRYNAAATSLPRAASWDRNTLGLVTRAFFNQEGVLIGSEQRASSSGKFFADDLDPRYTDEYMVGTARQVSDRLSARFYARHRYSTNFWEDTNNDARVGSRYAAPPEIAELGLYIPDLAARIAQVGSGSTYVIAQLDGAFTKYYEATLESDFRATNNLMLRGTYTWSHYYGNFDQDSTSTTYDFATFIGSSNLADGPGRNVWDRKYGNLHGDRRHLFKINGAYTLPWNSTLGAFAIYQSGHAWEAWDHRPYLRPGNTSTSDVNRYAEPAGSRTTDPHYQLDLNYTQNIPFGGLNVQLIGEMFNVFDKQTGYSPFPAVNSSLFGTPRVQYAPRRYQLAVRLVF